MRFIHYSVIFPVFVIMFFLSNTTIHAQDKDTYQVTVDNLKVRTAADSSSEVIGHLQAGDNITGFNEKHGWMLTYYNGEEAWVAAHYLSPTEQTEEGSKKQSNSESSSSNSSDGTLKGRTIMLDPSHGGKDPGSIGIDGIKEKDIALDYTQTVANELEKQGATVLLTRTSDNYVSLEDRVRISESYATDAFISLHFNAFTSSDPNGVSTHYYDANDDHELANHVQGALQQQTGFKDRGVRQDDYHVLRKNSDTSILVELGFITNPSDVQAIQNNENASAVATAIADGLQQYFN